MPPAVIGGAIGAVGSIGGALIGSSAAGSAAEKQAAAAAQTNALQKRMYDQGRADQQPYQQAGLSALYGAGGMFKRKDGLSGIAKKAYDPTARKAFIEGKVGEFTNSAAGVPTINGLRAKMLEQEPQIRAQAEAQWEQENNSVQDDSIDTSQYELDQDLTRRFTNEDFVKDPGYDFRMQEGQKALERSAAARGGLQNGGTMKALAEYGQGFASNEYGNAYNRFTNDQSNRFNRLSSIAGMGQNATNANAAAGQNYAGQVSNNIIGNANAQGAAGIAQGNAWGGALSSLGKMGMEYAAGAGSGGSSGGGNWGQRSSAALNTGAISGNDYSMPANKFWGMGG